MDKIHFIKAIARLWKTTTTDGKIKLILSLVAIILGLGSFGYWIGTIDMSHRIATIESKRERQLTELKGNNFEYISEFSSDDWINNGYKSNQLKIPFLEHYIDNPQVTVQKKEENGNWKDVGCAIEVDSKNNIIITVVFGFNGRFILK